MIIWALLGTGVVSAFRIYFEVADLLLKREMNDRR